MLMRVLSLDISASSTGWAFAFGQARGIFEYGLIKTNPKFGEAERLSFFRQELTKLLQEFRPTHIVIEDVYSGVNVQILKLLAKFAGVAEECCMSVSSIEPVVLSTNTVKAYFKAKNKKDIFDIIIDIFGWDDSKIDYKKHNDLTDAIAQLICFYDKVLGYRKFRFEKEYGYLYEV